MRIVATECAAGFHVIQPAHAEIGGEPVGKLAVFVGIGAVHIAQRLGSRQLGHGGEVKQGGVELHFVPAEPASALAHGEKVEVGFEAAVGDGVDAVEVFAKEF